MLPVIVFVCLLAHHAASEDYSCGNHRSNNGKFNPCTEDYILANNGQLRYPHSDANKYVECFQNGGKGKKGGYRCRVGECDDEYFVPELQGCNIDDCDSGPCGNNGDCIDGPLTYQCECHDGYIGTNCDVEGTVILRRVDASVDFKRNLADYVAGFGDPAGNYWHGLERIHALTSAAPMQLMVTMETFEGESAYASYSSFSVGDAASGYELAISGYSGTAGDSMYYHNGMKFTTVDNDVDRASFNCAHSWHGGWWYNKCHDANPTGLYLNGAGSAIGQGINWRMYKGYRYSLKRIEFTITPIE